MFSRDKSARIETLLGPGSRCHGSLDFAGGLHLDGRVDGNVIADASRPSSLTVSETGEIDGNVEAGSVTLNGRVRGDILSRGKVTLGAKAQVQGNVFYGVIEMASGAQIMGKLTQMPDVPPEALAARARAKSGSGSP